MKQEETQLDITHLPWIQFSDWMFELSKCKYGVQLGTAAAGSFNLNCAYLGIPCIGYDNVNTQYKLHPNLTVPEGDVQQARKLAIKLKNDDNFYAHCSSTAKSLYKELYSEDVYKATMNQILNRIF
jgi:hypothetical protein